MTWASKMALHVNVPATKLDNLNSIPGLYTGERKNQLLKLFSDLLTSALVDTPITLSVFLKGSAV